MVKKMTLKRKLIVLAGTASLGLCSLGAYAASPAPDLNGYWMVERYTDKLSTVDGNAPPLKPQAKALYEKNLAMKAKGDHSFDPVARCVMPGMPRLMFLPYAIEFVQTPKRLAMLSAWNHVYRLIEMNAREEPADYPLNLGLSNGRWKGTSLVVTTRDFTEDTWLDASGLPHSAALKLVEKYDLSKDGATLTNVITVDDPETFTKVWQTKVKYKKLPDSYEFSEDACLDRIEQGEAAVVAQTPATSTAGPVLAANQGAANVQLLKSFLADIRPAAASGDPKKLRAVVERYMSADYVQHAAGLPPGREGYIQMMSMAFKAGPPPGGAPKDVHFFGDGEYVVWVSEMPSETGKAPKLLFNMMRVADGKLKEHWDSR